MSGAVRRRNISPEALDRVEQRLGALDGRVWATARYEDHSVKVRLNIAIPYDDLRGRVAVHGIELTAEDGTAFETAFQDLIDQNVPRLLREGRRAAAQCLLTAEQGGEMEDE